MGSWLTRAGQIEPCVYQPGQPSRYEVMIPTEGLSPAEVDQLHASGARRSGWLFYKLNCPDCSNCQPLRVKVDEFRRSRSQRRVWTHNQDLQVVVGRPQACEQRVALYNRHLFERRLNASDKPISLDQYESWLLQSGIQTLEFQYIRDGNLLAVGLVDVGENDASSVYFYFDPSASKRSLGTFSLLYELHWLAEHQKRYHYLGFYNASCGPLRYKAGFAPHELLQIGDKDALWTLDTP